MRGLLQLPKVHLWVSGVFALDALGWRGRKPQVQMNVCRTRGGHLLKATSLAPGYPSLISLACFLQGHWSSEQGSAAFAVWLERTDEVFLQCYILASCTLPHVMVDGTSWI